MIKWHERDTIGYDVFELLSHLPIVGSKKDRNKKSMICSRLVYVNLCLDGCRNEIETKDFNNAVTPNDLYNTRCLIEVDGWKNDEF
jgi:hypothetical protein